MQLPLVHQPHQDASLVANPKQTLALQIGELVRAEVVTVTDTNVAIRMKGTVLEARTNVPLMEGETITLRVEGNEGEIRLRLIHGGEEVARTAKDYLLATLNALKGLKPAAEDMKTLYVMLRGMPEMLKESIPGMKALEKMLISPEGLTGDGLQRAVADSGVCFEAKLRLLVMREGGASIDGNLRAFAEGDMKAVLLSLKQALEQKETSGRLGFRNDALMSSVDNLLKTLEALQLQSRLNETLQVFVPFIWQDLKEGELVFRESDEGQQGEKAYSCTVNLDLEQAGKVSARVLLQSGRIHADLITGNEGFFNLLQNGLPLLVRQFEAVGLRPGDITIRREPAIDFESSPAGKLDVFA